jgi:polar amino acid transport system permease protein
MWKTLIVIAVILVVLAGMLIHNAFRFYGTYIGRTADRQLVQIELCRNYATISARHLYDGVKYGTYEVDEKQITVFYTVEYDFIELNGVRDGKTIAFYQNETAGFPEIQLTFTTTIDRIINWLPALFQASWITLSLTVVSMSLALVLSVFLALGKISKKVLFNKPCGAYIFFFRGTPLLMQLFFIYYALPMIHPALTIQSRFIAAVVAFTLNIAAYCAEIIRAAIQSIDKGQMEACKALGLSYGKAMRLVVIPQAYRRMIPPLCNEFILVLKDVSIVFVIGLMDLTSQTRKIQSSSATALVFIPAMGIYLLMTFIFTTFFDRLEKKLSKYE